MRLFNPFGRGPGAPEALSAVDVGHGSGVPARMADSLILQHSEEVWAALTAPGGGGVYSCGGASGYGEAVTRSLRVKRVVADLTGLDAAGVEAFMARLLEEDRVVEDYAD